MNDLVDAMNDVLRSAVEKAGPQVHFIDYDRYVDVTGGRYCQPGRDEYAGRGANLPNLFFYQTKTIDQAWQIPPPPPPSILGKRQIDEAEDLGPANSTLGAMYGALLEEAIKEYAGDDGYAAVDDGNVNPDIEALVEDEIEEKDDSSSGIKERASFLEHRWSPRNSGPPFARNLNDSAKAAPSWNTTLVDSGHTVDPSHHVQAPRLGSKVYKGGILSTASFTGGNTTFRFSNATNSTEGLSTGTVIANNTHIMIAGFPIPKPIVKLFIPDTTARTFHPTQGGHVLIANLILYQMRVDRAKRQGTHLIT
jgi:hypothetical protein